MIIRAATNLNYDDLILYSFGNIDYVARVIGLPGDSIEHRLETGTVYRNSEPVAAAPSGYEILFSGSPFTSLAANQIAVYIQDAPRDPVLAVIHQNDVLGAVVRIYKFGQLDTRDWAYISFFSVLTLALILLPFVHFVQHRPNGRYRLGLLVIHSAFVFLLALFVVAPLIPNDPLGLGFSQSIWWWIPVTVVASFDVEPLAIALAFLFVQWLRLRRQRNMDR